MASPAINNEAPSVGERTTSESVELKAFEDLSPPPPLKGADSWSEKADVVDDVVSIDTAAYGSDIDIPPGFGGLLEVRCSSSRDVRIGLAGDDIALRLVLSDGFDATVQVDYQKGYETSVLGVSLHESGSYRPILEGTGGSLVWIDITGDRRGQVSVRLDAGIPLARQKSVVRCHSAMLKLMSFEIPTGNRSSETLVALGGETALWMRGSQVVLESEDVQRLDDVRVELATVPSILGFSARKVQVAPAAMVFVPAGVRLNEVEIQPAGLMDVAAGAVIGRVAGRKGEVTGALRPNKEKIDGIGRLRIGSAPIVEDETLSGLGAPEDGQAEDDKRDEVIVGHVSGLDVELSASRHGSVWQSSSLIVTRHMESVGVRRVGPPGSESQGLSPRLGLSASCSARDVDFKSPRLINGSDEHSHVVLDVGERATLTGVSGSVSFGKIEDALIRADETTGLEVCSFGDFEYEKVELENVIVPIGLPFGQWIPKAAENFAIFEPHPLTWSSDGSLFGTGRGLPSAFRERLMGIARSVRSPVDLSPEATQAKNALVVLDRLVRTKALSASARIGVRYALLARRQLHSPWRSERLLLLAGRCLGFGTKIAQPLALWLLTAFVVAAVAANLDGQSVDLSVHGLGQFLVLALNMLVEPLALVRGLPRGSELDSMLDLEPFARGLLRISLTLPLASALLAITRRSTWTRG